ncbi:RagB/SusD family nutrient uptake outer membrane protein [Paraflavitalea sp. CAU 1676]|uniref:RagB/SusD family nutrient uptake outer membrane protein n=1 Tax=Paraflavitalea sp. CAU 1676 TaxID=3032598 RepID=UPI0023DC3B0B|nr:RagB/SusD family nutrient uptake outer membrane protein [Paraflavitalea sp. CAU 1676]MDF2187956.1 RagB/SusD family nutrient uptake outer membrane protein [Paraflavitalea sp. CAU 1676]
MNRITIILVAAGLVSLSSCSKFLEENPNNAIPSETAVTDVGTARAAITGVYDAIQGYFASNYVTLGTITADNVIANGTLTQYLQLDQNAIPTDNVTTVAAYQGIYKVINAANSVITYVPAVTDPLLTTAEKNKILGEAYFARALGYFDLGRGWGGVQLQLKPTTVVSDAKGIKRSTLDQTYDQVLADLIEAEKLLPEDATTRNRAQKSTARALRARLHLYRKQWADAEQYASQVIANTAKYELIPYKNFFTAPFLTKESVFELTFSANDRNSYWNLWYPSSGGGQYTLKPAAGFVTKVKNAAIGGSRTSLIAGSGTDVYGVLYNASATSTDPSYVIRIAELYLIRAEARAQQGKLTGTDGAIADLNAVRARAGVAGTAATTKDEVLLAIEEENGIEFAFEAHRWFDLVRTERAGAVLGLTNRNFWLFPLPFADVLSDPDLEGKNNPGY